MTDEHRCRSGQDCFASNETGAAFTSKPSTLCHTCVNGIQARLGQLPHLQEMLRTYLANSLVPQGGGAKVSSSSDPGTPINLHVLDVLDELQQALDLAGGAGARIADVINRPMESYQIRHHGGWRDLDMDGVQVALNVSRTWKRAYSASGLSLTWERRAVKCPRCDLPTLGSTAGSGTVSCSNCGGVMTRDEYDRICIIKAE